MSDAWLLALCSYLLCQTFVSLGAFWCHPTTCAYEWIAWWFFIVNCSLLVSIFLVFLICWLICTSSTWHQGE